MLFLLYKYLTTLYILIISMNESNKLLQQFSCFLDSSSMLFSFNMVSEPPLRCWADLPPYYIVHVFG